MAGWFPLPVFVGNEASVPFLTLYVDYRLFGYAWNVWVERNLTLLKSHFSLAVLYALHVGRYGDSAVALTLRQTNSGCIKRWPTNTGPTIIESWHAYRVTTIDRLQTNNLLDLFLCT